MAKYANAAVLDGGLDYVEANGTKMLLLKAYTLLDSYATVVANAICTITIDGTDMSIAGADGAARVLTFTEQTGTASGSSGATPDLHIAITNGTNAVLLVTDETSDQVITSGNPVTIPTFTYTRSQPA